MTQHVSLSRAEMREFFQPSRVVLGVVRDKAQDRYNIVTFAFNTYCSYSPLMFMVAIHNINYSYELFKEENEFVVSVPGESLHEQAMFCGVNSGRALDKFAQTKLTMLKSEKISTPGIDECLLNMECEKVGFYVTGDHALVVGKVINIRKNTDIDEPNLLSVSKSTKGVKLLKGHQGHRLAVLE